MAKSTGIVFQVRLFMTGAVLLFLSPSAQASTVASFSVAGARFSPQVTSFKEMKMKNVIPQTSDYSCGPASLATILDYYYGEHIKENDIIGYFLLTTNLKKVKSRKGFSLLDLKHYAQFRGYDAIGYKMDLEFLVKLDRPALVPINIKDYNHFVIFRGLRHGRVFLADPVLGQLTMRAEKFKGIWKGGIGMVITKAGEEPRPSTLSITGQEETFLAERFVQHILGEGALGKIYADGEF